MHNLVHEVDAENRWLMHEGVEGIQKSSLKARQATCIACHEKVANGCENCPEGYWESCCELQHGASEWEVNECV